jgi:hypothetical protein
MNFRFLPEAKAEFDASADWYDAQRTGLGIDFVARVKDALDRIAANPQVYGTVYRRVSISEKIPFCDPLPRRGWRSLSDFGVSYLARSICLEIESVNQPFINPPSRNQSVRVARRRPTARRSSDRAEPP